jgi:hypothetical protein
MTIVKTSYREHGAATRMAYIGRDKHAVKDQAGRELSPGEQATFIKQSEDYEFEREVIVSPEHGDELSDREFELRTRQTMREFTENRPSARYVYAIHRDTETPHAHVLVTGTREDLYMDRRDIRDVRERAGELFREEERAVENDRELGQDPTHDAAELQLAAEADTGLKQADERDGRGIGR